MAVQTTGFSSSTPDRLVLDAGAVYKNLTYDDVAGEWNGSLLGATSGGNEFAVEIEPRDAEIDGTKTRVKGLKFVNSHNAQLVTNVKEITADTIKTAIGMADSGTSEDANLTKVTGRDNIQDTDYLDNIAYVGRVSGSADPIIIILKNALSAEGFSTSFEEDGEAVIPITFHAHQDAADVGTGVLPYEIHYPSAV